MAKTLRLALHLATRARADRRLEKEADSAAKERHGSSDVARPAGPLVWFHNGADAQSAATTELAKRILNERDDLNFLITTTADTRRQSDGHCIHQFCPDDTIPAVRRFLDHWKPDVAIWTETDLRAALISETDARGVPIFLVDAQTAKADGNAMQWSRAVLTDLINRFHAILAGDRKTAAVFRGLGADPSRLEVAGFLQEGTPALPYNETERAAFAEILGARPTWLAACVQPGELDAVIAAHRRAQRRAHRLVLILVPADPADGPDWAAKLAADGYTTALRSADEEPDADTQIYVADTTGEMGLWYRLAPISFLGTSLFDGGGINPFEPAALGSAIIHGAHVSDFAEPYARLREAGAARMVSDAKDLRSSVDSVLSPAKAAKMAHQAWEVCSAGAEATDRITDLVLTEIERL